MSYSVPFRRDLIAMKLSISNGTDIYEQDIPVDDVTMGSNSVKITNQSLLDAFKNQSNYTEYDYAIVTTYDYNNPNIPPGIHGYEFDISHPDQHWTMRIPTPTTPGTYYFMSLGVGKFSPIKTTSIISLGEIGNITSPTFKLPVTTNSTGVLSFSSSDTSVATVDSSGEATFLADGTTIITVYLEASADGNYTSGSSKYLFSRNGGMGTLTVKRRF